MTQYALIDNDTGCLIAVETTKAAVLTHTPYEPTDLHPDAESWQDVVDAAEGYDDGLCALVECFRVVPYDPFDFRPTDSRDVAHNTQAG